jgi:hypothetical protein
VLQVFVEDLVPGNEAAHAKAERGWVSLAREARLPDPILEITPLFGPRQCWIVNGFASFAALEKASLSQPWFVYQAVAGRTDPTYLVIVPLPTLGELDALIASQGKVVGALGEEGLRLAMKVAAEAYGTVDSVLLRVRPETSYVPSAWAKEAPEAWRGAALIEDPPTPR